MVFHKIHLYYAYIMYIVSVEYTNTTYLAALIKNYQSIHLTVRINASILCILRTQKLKM